MFCWQLMPVRSVAVLLLMLQVAVSRGAVHPVLTYKNTTLLGQLVTSSTLIWETYDPKDSKQLQFAVEGGKYITDEEHYPIYVCRVTIDGVVTSGHTEKVMQKHVCVAAHYKDTRYHHFDMLVNKGHLGKVVWRSWRKFNAGIPIGAIRIDDESYIARHRASHNQSVGQAAGEAAGKEHRGADFMLGRLDPVGLGKIKVIEDMRDKDYNEGEVLVETEPFRYELRDIKLDNIRADLRDNVTELASSVLANRGDGYSVVETVMSYQFDYMQYWGAHEGVARGLPTKVFEKDAPLPTEINWGLRYGEKRYETKSVNTQLWPGTALNVTLKGNYVTLEAPYAAKLFAFYYGSEDTVSRKITSEVRKSYLKDIKLEYSPVYWIENGSFVPTTTTTTTSTTSTTARATTSTSTGTGTGEPIPLHEPPQVNINSVGDTHSGPDSLEKSLREQQAGNEIPDDEMPDNMSAKHQKTALAGLGGGGGGGAAFAVASPPLVLVLIAAASSLASLPFAQRPAVQQV